MNPPTVRAVLDTSALFSPTLRRTLHAAAVSRLYVGIWSPWIIAELNRVLTWDWIRRNRGTEQACARAAKIMMELLLPSFDLVNPLPPYPTTWPQLEDVWDVPIWAAAIHGRATHVVSENIRDFPPIDEAGITRYQGVEYLRCDDFFAVLGL